MSTLLLLRHAKAAWPEPKGSDFDRALDERGLAESRLIGSAMASEGLVPDLVICSTARRARETLDGVRTGFDLDDGMIDFAATLYTGDAAAYLDAIHAVRDADCVLIVGHNPMLEDVAQAFATAGQAEARETLAQGFPTAGLAVIRFPGPLREAGTRDARLERFLIPADF